MQRFTTRALRSGCFRCYRCGAVLRFDKQRVLFHDCGHVRGDADFIVKTIALVLHGSWIPKDELLGAVSMPALLYVLLLLCKDGSLRNPHLTEKCIAAPMILSIYVAIADGGLRAFVLGGVHRVDIAATFKRLPEHADELRKLANRQGSLGFCSWEQRLAPRSAVLALTEPVPGISQQRAALLDALQGAQAGAAGAGAVYESQLRNEVRSTTLQSDMREPAAQQAAKSTFTEPGDSKVSSSLCFMPRWPVCTIECVVAVGSWWRLAPCKVAVQLGRQSSPLGLSSGRMSASGAARGVTCWAWEVGSCIRGLQRRHTGTSPRADFKADGSSSEGLHRRRQCA